MTTSFTCAQASRHGNPHYHEYCRDVTDAPLVETESSNCETQGLRASTRGRVTHDGEVGPSEDRVGVLGAQHPLIVGDHLFLNGDGLTNPARGPIGAGEVVTRNRTCRFTPSDLGP
jgi:hypothetical protein